MNIALTLNTIFSMNTPILKYLFALLLYGTIGSFLRFVEYSSEFVVLCRGLIGSLFIFTVFLCKKHQINYQAIKRNLIPMVLSGMCLGFNWIFLFEGYKYSLAISSLCNYIAPIAVVFISALFLKEKLNIKQILCIVMAFIGMLMITGVFDNSESVNINAVINGTLAALGFIGLVILNKKLTDIEALEKTLIQLFFSALTVLPYVMLKNGFPTTFDLRSTLIVILLGLLHTGVAYICYFGSINILPSRTIAILGYLEPVLNVLLGFLIFHENMSFIGIIGAIIIITSSIANELLN